MRKKYDLLTRTRRFPLREDVFSGGGPNATAAFSVTQEKLQHLHDAAVSSLNIQVAKHALRFDSEVFDQNYFATFVVYEGEPYIQVCTTFQLRPKRKLALVK